MFNPNPILGDTFSVALSPPDVLTPDGGGNFVPVQGAWDNALPTIRIFQDPSSGSGAIDYAPPVFSDDLSETQFVTIVATTGNGFQAGKSYSVIARGQANGQPVSYVIAAFILRTGVNVTQWNGAAVPVPAVAGVPTVADSSAAAIKAKTDLIPSAPAAVSDVPTANANADALLDRVDGIETGWSLKQVMRIVAAFVGGKSRTSGGIRYFKNLNDTKDVLYGPPDRSSVTRDVS